MFSAMNCVKTFTVVFSSPQEPITKCFGVLR